MSGDSSERSNIVDITYQQLHTILSGHIENRGKEDLTEILKPRIDNLKSISSPFGSPSDESKKKIESGSVVLKDGVTLQVDDNDKPYIFAVSSTFQIDQVEALILLRLFLYNVGLSSNSESTQNSGSSSLGQLEKDKDKQKAIEDKKTSVDDSIVELLEAFTPFYHSERLSILRCLIPLFRSRAIDAVEPIGETANEILPLLIPGPKAFASSLMTEYFKKSRTPLPKGLDVVPRKASEWVKQNAREQLVLLEVLFWTMWEYAGCDGGLVLKIYETAYTTNLGSNQANGNLLLDDEGSQLLQDIAALWILLTIEVLELERVAEPGGLEIAGGQVSEPGVENDDGLEEDIYWNSPTHLEKLHNIVVSHEGSQFACTYLAWSFVLSKITQFFEKSKEIPPAYSKFLNLITPTARMDNRSYKEREPVWLLMAKSCLDVDAGLFRLLLTMLTSSPVYVTAVAWRTGSTITDPNAVAYRSVLKGLVIALVELIPIEHVPNFDLLVEVWLTLFGRSESKSIEGISRQYWLSDFPLDISRRAIFDVARSRFPIQPKPLIRLLRSMTASGFLDTDPLSTSDGGNEGERLTEDRVICAERVFEYLKEMSSFTQVVPLSACMGGHALYEKVPERYTSASSSAGPTCLSYVNLRELKLPGGSTLPPRTVGRLLSGDLGEFVVISWNHGHSGWKVLLEFLTDYVWRRRMSSGGSAYHDVSFGRRQDPEHPYLRLEDVGVEMDEVGDEDLVTDILDLIRSVVQGNESLAELVLEELENGEPVVVHAMQSSSDSTPPDLVQLTTMILEEALSRSNSQRRQQSRNTNRQATIPTRLITSAMSVLSALLALPKYSNRVWLYIRSTASLFGSDRNIGVASSVLSSERLTGHYTMTLSLLNLVQSLFLEASTSLLSVLQTNPKLQQVKEEVLLRAARFVHSEIWIEFGGWKYVQVGDKFEIGRRVAGFYGDVLKHSGVGGVNSKPDSDAGRPFGNLAKCIADALLGRATISAVYPIVSTIMNSGAILSWLYEGRRYGDARRLIYLLESHLSLARQLLNWKVQAGGVAANGLCLLEQAFCTREVGMAGSGILSSSLGFIPSASSIAAGATTTKRLDPIDALAALVKERGMGTTVPVQAMQVLFSLCASLSASSGGGTVTGSPATIIGHLSDPEATVGSMVRIVQHPYDEIELRNAVWNFITLAVDKEPALAGLFVTGHFRVPSFKGKEKEVIEDKDNGKGKGKEKEDDVIGKTTSALGVAYNILSKWKGIWEANPQLLASLLRFLDVVWEHGHEHKVALEPYRQDASFFGFLAEIVQEELGPIPDDRLDHFHNMSNGDPSAELNEAVQVHAYRTIVKAHALHILGLDIKMALQAQGKGVKVPQKPLSYTAVQDIFRSEDSLTDFIGEAASRTYDPSLHDEFLSKTKSFLSALELDHLQSQDPIVERFFGNNFAFSLDLLQVRLEPFFGGFEEECAEVTELLASMNLNLSIAQAQTTLTQSWQHFLLQVVPFVRGDQAVRPILLSNAASISADIANEKRSGDMMSTVHNARLSLLLAILEVAWFSTTDKPDEVKEFVALVKNLRGIILNPAQPPAKSFLGKFSVPFHRSVLQIAYFCAKHCRSLANRSKALNADQRLTIGSTLEAILDIVIDALRLAFDSARIKFDLDLDQDMELLVAVFEQCTRLDLNPSPVLWLTKCQETDVIRASLQLVSRMDLVGFSDLTLLRSRKQPLYAPHVLAFHTALAGITASAERLASEGVLAAYSENPLSNAIKSGLIDVIIPEIPGERSPAHISYCTMLAVVAGVATALGRHGHYFDSDACGLAQLYGDQIHRALSWTIDDSLTLPLLEEIEQTINLFSAIAQGSVASGRTDVVQRTLSLFNEDSLLLLQQLNYALTHPNHLASVFEPITAGERTRFEADSKGNASLSSPLEMINPMKRPFLARLVHRLLGLSSSILSTLTSISDAETILVGEFEDWPDTRVLIVPHSKVVLGEPASVGTLLELGNCSLDVLRQLVDRPSLQSITPPAPGVDKPLDVRDSVIVTRRNLESVLLYVTTQLAIWLTRSELDSGSNEMETEDHSFNDPRNLDTPDRRTKHKSMSMAERLRRGMSGEMAADVQALLLRARPVVTKSDPILGKKSVDLLPILSRFVQERILSSA